LIHDAQYTPDEFKHKAHWGHCTIGYAVAVATQAKVKSLALFHHDPSHSDDELQALHREASEAGSRCGLQVIGAREGVSINLTK
jgi:ribonuclease BN (tRNA processing enzyme)